MQEYFGKRGMSVSVEVFIKKLFEAYHKQVYLVTLDRCDQGVVETLCIADKVLQKFSRDNPDVKELFLKTDNAGTVFHVIVYFCTQIKIIFRKLSC